MEKTERSLGEYLTTLRRRKGSLLSAMMVILITISLVCLITRFARNSEQL
jgi:cell division protein FtsX